MQSKDRFPLRAAVTSEINLGQMFYTIRHGSSERSPLLQSGFQVGLETWLPILQGIADKGFSGHLPYPQRLFLQLLSAHADVMNGSGLTPHPNLLSKGRGGRTFDNTVHIKRRRK
jgi:hypothetical protein